LELSGYNVNMNKLKQLFWYLFHHRIKVLFFWSVLATGVFVFLGIYLWYLHNKINFNEIDIKSLNTKFEQYQLGYENFLFSDHLNTLENLKLNQVKGTIETELERVRGEDSAEKLAKIEEIYSLYQTFIDKTQRNQGVSISVTEMTDKIDDWGKKLLNQDYDALNQEIVSANSTLDSSYQGYLASLVPVVIPTQPSQPSQPTIPVSTEGYSFQVTATIRGNFSTYLIKMPLSKVTVKTVTANSSDCTNNCPTKTLAEYISENQAYAGMNGTYFCPPDYASCAGKTNSYDFAVYNSNLGKWLNQHALGWDSTGFAGFNGSTPVFAQKSNQYGNSGVTAGITNFPSLVVTNSEVTVDESKLTSYQKDVKGIRGAIGADDSNVYLVLISNANVTDLGYVMKALGAKNALNLDGGGSAAMYIGGSYKVGPGRRLPNAVVLVKK